MQKRIHKRPVGQQSLDLFFKPRKEKIEVKETTNQTQPSQQNDIAKSSPEITTYTPIITYSDFEFGFSSDDEDEEQLDVKDNMRNINLPTNNRKNIGNSNIDNDTDFEKEEESESESNILYNESQISSPTILTRHKEQEKKKEKINIFTPTWKYTSSSEKSKDNLCSNFRFDLNSMCNIHYQLEIIEKRIQNGDDEEHDHPAMCVQVLDEEGINKVTDEERKLRNSYKNIECDKIKPSFWEPRCYDDEYSQLTRNDNKILQNIIYLANDADSDDIVTWKPEDNLIPPENNKMPNYYINNSINKGKEMVKNDMEQNNSFSSSNSPKYVFVNKSETKMPTISFIFNNKKDTCKIQSKIESKKNSINSFITNEKSNSGKDNKKNISVSFNKERSNKLKSKNSPHKKEVINPFDESNSESSSEDDTDFHSATESNSTPNSEYDTISDSDSINEKNNDNDNSNDNSNNKIIQKDKVSTSAEKQKITKQKLLKLSSLLFDTDSTDSETDLEDF